MGGGGQGDTEGTVEGGRRGKGIGVGQTGKGSGMEGWAMGKFRFVQC